MSIKDKLKKLFFEEIEDENSTENLEIQNNPTNNNPTKQEDSQNENTNNTTNKVDQNILQNLLEYLEEKNIPGPDYFELKNAANTDVLRKAIPDENTRFTVSYATLKATAPQLNKQVILSSLDVYIQAMEEERQNGLNQFENMWQENIVSKENEILRSKEELEILYKRINELNNFIEKSSIELEKSKKESQEKKDNFNYTVDHLIETFVKDKEKLDKIIND